MSLPNQPAPTNEADFGTLEYYQNELQSDTAWRWLDAARNLADKAVANFERALTHDYATTLGVNADETKMDEAMIKDVQTQCEELHAKIIRDCQTQRDSDVNRVRGLNGGYMSAVVGLFKIATLRPKAIDGFLDIATLEGDYSLDSLGHSTLDGAFDKHGFNIDDAAQRQLAIRAIMSEQNATLYHNRVRT